MKQSQQIIETTSPALDFSPCYKTFIVYKERIKYRLIGYQPVGIDYNVLREEVAEWKNGYWYPYGCGKRIVNFVIEKVVEL